MLSVLLLWSATAVARPSSTPPAAAAAAEAPAEPAAAAADIDDAAADADAAEMTDEELAAALDAEARELDASLHYQTGTIRLPCGKAELALPDGYRYLDPADTDRVLQSWGNPPDDTTEGMLVPAGASLVDDGGWAVVLGYLDDGHVDDSDAASIDYDALLVQMKRDAAADNEERARLGIATGELLGWAEPPHYDRATRKLYWAKEIQFEGNDATTLNYAVRVLGREGVLELNAVATTAQLADVRPAMAQMLAFSDFTDGNRYTDYVPGSDRSSGYGVAAVVAGGVVTAKAVGTKGFVAILIAAKKILLAIGLAIAGFFKAIWSRLRRLTGRRDAAAPSPPAGADGDDA
ncbi:MAG: DUF2167 domain-containing protein [Kofleriaceae bacterium]|nr:DUF2167 domain-containing protein [Myxococcales bacterium]MCB9562483.1 DUF2167 domain-containing protein [Kofleriaceae bacterium]MCB9570758.1 DUF2167 domain-containing protein [Kofleriaceae bacterium]